MALALQHSAAAAQALGRLQKILSHACCHGSTRRKNTGWLSTPGVFDPLAATCKDDHPHEPWGVKWQAGSWIFDTSAGAQYPHLLGQRATECIVKFLVAKGFVIERPLRLHDKATAVQGKQSKKHRPLVPEYHRILSLAASDAAPVNSKQLPPHLSGGRDAEEAGKQTDVPMSDVVKYGIYHTPKQFLPMVANALHPMDSTDHLESFTKQALDFVFKYPKNLVQLERRKNLLQAKLLAAKLNDDEKALHAGLPLCLQKVLAGKKLLLWKALLERYGYDDLAVVPFMFEGVRLVGVHDTPECYPAMLCSATLTLEDLQ